MKVVDSSCKERDSFKFLMLKISVLKCKNFGKKPSLTENPLNLELVLLLAMNGSYN